MLTGQDFISGMELHGSSKARVIEYLSRIKLELPDNSDKRELSKTLDRIINSYFDVYDYTIPSKSVLKNLAKRLDKVRPVLMKALECVDDEEDEKAIKAILENYNSLQTHAPKSFLESIKISINKAWVSPYDAGKDL